jgi:hypothetical protein
MKVLAQEFVLLLDVSTPLVSTVQSPFCVAPGSVYATGPWSAPRLVYTAEAYALPVRVYTLVTELHLDVSTQQRLCFSWTRLHHRELSCSWTMDMSCFWTCLYYRGMNCTCMYLDYRSLCCSWTCLHYRGLYCTPTFPHTVAWAAPGRVYSTGAWAAPRLVYEYTTEACTTHWCFWKKEPELTCLHYRGLCCTWACLHYRGLCPSCTCLQHKAMSWTCTCTGSWF